VRSEQQEPARNEQLGQAPGDDGLQRCLKVSEDQIATEDEVETSVRKILADILRQEPHRCPVLREQMPLHDGIEGDIRLKKRRVRLRSSRNWLVDACIIANSALQSRIEPRGTIAT